MTPVPQLRAPADMAEFERLAHLFGRVWGVEHPSQIFASHTLRALAFADNYVVAAFDGDRIVAGAVAYRAGGTRLHSDVAGVDAAWRGRGLGLAVKRHQRDWARRRDIDCIQWTFDPTLFRNARFNIHRMGAVAVRYLPDFYGRMDDEINAEAGPSDRLLVEWRLDSDRVRDALAGRPHPGGRRRIAIGDKDRLRRELSAAFDAGLYVTGVSPDRHYLVERAG